MSDLARLLQQYGYGEQPNPLAQDGVSYDTSNVLAGMPKPNPLAAALRTAMNAIPENKELPPPQFFMDPRSISMANMLRGGLDTAASWIDYGNKPQPSDYKPSEMLAPLGAGLMGTAMAPANALGAFGGRLRGYHWSPKAGEISDTNRFAPLSHFGSTADQANERYAKQVLAEGTPEWKAKHSEHGAVVPVDIEMSNPLRIHDHYRHDPEVVAALIDWAEKYGSDATRRMNLTTYQGPVRTAVLGAKSPEDAAAVISKALSERGYDGLVYKNNYEAPGDSYIVTKPETVKSATTGKTLYSSPYGLPPQQDDR